MYKVVEFRNNVTRQLAEFLEKNKDIKVVQFSHSAWIGADHSFNTLGILIYEEEKDERDIS